MPRIRHLLVLLIAVLATSQAHAQSRREDWPEGSAMRTGFEMSDKVEAATKVLDQETNKLLGVVADEHIGIDLGLQNAIAGQAKAWKVFRTDECELAGAIEGGGGFWPEVHRMECELDLTEQRLKTIRNVESCIADIEPDARKFSSFDCLNGLRATTSTPNTH